MHKGEAKAERGYPAAHANLEGSNGAMVSRWHNGW